MILFKEKYFIILLSTFIMFSCNNNEKILTNTINIFWGYILNANYSNVWEMFSENLKNNYSKEDYIFAMKANFNKDNLQIIKFKIKYLDKMSNDKYIVSMELFYNLNNISEVIYDDWIFENGEWKFDGGGRKVKYK